MLTDQLPDRCQALLQRRRTALGGGRAAKTVVVDRGYRGAKVDSEIELIIPGKKRPRQDSKKRRRRRLCRRRAGIEPVIGHVKSDCRMQNREKMLSNRSSVVISPFVIR